LQCDPPNGAFIHQLFIHLVLVHQLKKVASLKALSNNTEGIGELIKE
jgi:hypothetical protein